MNPKAIRARRIGIVPQNRRRVFDQSGNPSSIAQHSIDVLSSVLVKPVFWGSQWLQHSATPPLAGEILWAIRSIFHGPYMSGLAQYGVGNGALDPNPVFTGFDSDPPQNFHFADIEGMLGSLVRDKQISVPQAVSNFYLSYSPLPVFHLTTLQTDITLTTRLHPGRAVCSHMGGL